MGAQQKKTERRARVKRGIRSKVTGTGDRPRLTVYRSNRHIYAQVIDDLSGRTLVAASSRENDSPKGAPVEVSKTVGQRLAERAKEAGIQEVVFDRNGYKYHGRVQALAEGVREGGLQV